MKKQHFIKAAGIIFAFALIGYTADVVTRMYLGKQFGASHALDALLLATSIPSWIIGIYTATLNRAYIPLTIGFLKRNDTDGLRKFTTTITWISAIWLGLATLVIVVMLPGIGPILFGHQLTDTAFTTTRLAQLAFPSIYGAALTSILIGTLYASQRFFAASLILCIQKISAIAFLFWWTPKWGIDAAAGSITASWMLALVMLIVIAVLKNNISLAPATTFNHPVVKKFFSAALFLMIGALLTKSLLFIEPYLASFLSEGSVTAISYSKNIIMLPLGLISATIATALFPSQSLEGAGTEQKDRDQLKKSLLMGLRTTAFLTFPFIVFASLASVPLVRILFERGEFSSAATAQTARTLVYGMGFLLGSSLSVICLNTFYALKDMGTIIRIGLVVTTTNIIVDIGLMRVMGVEGIALAGSIVAVLSIGYMLWELRRKHIHITWYDALPFGLMSIATLCAYVITGPITLVTTHLSDIWQLIITGSVAAISFGIATIFLGMEEFQEIMRLLKRRNIAKTQREPGISKPLI